MYDLHIVKMSKRIYIYILAKLSIEKSVLSGAKEYAKATYDS